MEESLSSVDAGKNDKSIHVFLVSLDMFRLHPRRSENGYITHRDGFL